MNAQQTAIALKCLGAAVEGTMSFPEIVTILMANGFDGYAVDYRRNATTYFLPDGESLVLDNPHPAGAAVAEAFDEAGLVVQIKWAQSNASDYSYGAFSDNVRRCGCAGYIVSVPGKRVLYYARTGETHVEHMPFL
ncbi:MAG TPA: DUF1398 domain-containing protein [Devosiaceae bacterium]|jgi:uncharacterized protein YbcV (DUF1398 family)